MIEILQRLCRFVVGFRSCSIHDAVMLSLNEPEKFRKIADAQKRVLYKEINKHLKKSLLLYFVPYTLNRVEVMDWSGEYPQIIEYQPFMVAGERQPVNIDTGELLKARELLFYHPGFVGLPDFRTDFDRYHGQRINPSPRPRIFDLGMNYRMDEDYNWFLRQHAVAFHHRTITNPFIRLRERIREQLDGLNEHPPVQLFIDPQHVSLLENIPQYRWERPEIEGELPAFSPQFRDLVERRNEAVRRMFRNWHEIYEHLDEDNTEESDVQTQATPEEVAELIESIDTLLEGDDEPVEDEDRIPTAAPRVGS